jgi:hypothetical protein
VESKEFLLAPLVMLGKTSVILKGTDHATSRENKRLMLTDKLDLFLLLSLIHLLTMRKVSW